MFQTKIQKVGNSTVVRIGAEMLAVLEIEESDTVNITCSDENVLKTHSHDPALLEALAAAKEAMDKPHALPCTYISDSMWVSVKAII
jgi:antitoxin ChpS